MYEVIAKVKHQIQTFILLSMFDRQVYYLFYEFPNNLVAYVSAYLYCKLKVNNLLNSK